MNTVAMELLASVVVYTLDFTDGLLQVSVEKHIKS